MDKKEYEELFNNINSCIAIYEAADNGNDFIIRDFNKAAENADKIKREDIIGKSVLKVFPGVKDFGLFDVFKRVYKTGKPENLPISIYNDNRLSAWRENFVYKTSKGEIVAIYTDATAKKQAEERHKTILKTAMNGFWLTDMQGRLLEVNDAYCRMSGYSTQELLAMSIPDLEAAETNNDTTAHIRKVMAHGEDRFESRHRRKDGSIYDVEVSVQYQASDGGRFVAFLQDITERKQTEKALHKSEERYHQLLEAMTEAVYVLDAKWNYLLVNKQAAQFVQMPADEMLNRSQFDFFPDLKNTVFFDAMQHSMEECVRNQVVGKFIIDQRESWYELKIWPVPDGILCISADITERKQAEEKLIASENKFRQIAENIKEVFWISAPDWSKIYYISPAYFDVWGEEAEKLYEQPFLWFDSIIDEDKEIVRSCIPETITKDTKVIIFPDYRIKKSDGAIKWISARAFPVFDSEGNPYRIAGIAEDITERRHAEDTVIEQMKELRENRALLNNVSEISHVGGWIFNPKTLTQTWTDETFKILEIDTSKGEPKVPEGLDFIIPAYRPMAQKAIENAIKFGEPYDQEWEVITAKGNRRWVNAVAKAEKEGDEIKSVLGSFQDITERKNRENEITYISFHDHLTGLYNRRFFEEELKRLDSQRQLPLSLIMGDLNGLKIINDIFGHIEGDKLIIETSEILKKVCRSDDILARWGGDEFVILLPKTSISDAEDIAGRIKKECKKTITHKIPVSLSIGSATKEKTDQDIQTIVIDAESNMYKNKLAQKESLTSSIVFALEQALYEKSNETKEHTDRLHELALKLGKSINLPSHQLDDLSLLATLHDIGKVAIPEKILLKKGKLTKKEWAVIKRHPEIGFNIAQSSPQIAHIAKSILSCHENFDGSGYPLGLKGEKIPVISRIVLIVDAYDVMTSGRAYKQAMSKEDAIAELKRCTGTQFDPALVDRFISIITV